MAGLKRPLVAGTRVSLDSIVYAFLDGQSAETVAQAFPVLTLEQVYGATTYYLAHRGDVDRYLERRRQDFDAARRAASEADPMFYQKLAEAKRHRPDMMDEFVRKDVEWGTAWTRLTPVVCDAGARKGCSSLGRLRVYIGRRRLWMSAIHVEIDVPDDLARFRLPPGVQQRLQALLDKQDQGIPLSNDEREEAEGLVNLSEFLSLLRLRAERLGGSSHAG